MLETIIFWQNISILQHEDHSFCFASSFAAQCLLFNIRMTQEILKGEVGKGKQLGMANYNIYFKNYFNRLVINITQMAKLDENISSKHHINIASTKVCKSIGILYRARCIRSKFLRKQFYFPYKLLLKLRKYSMDQFKQN